MKNIVLADNQFICKVGWRCLIQNAYPSIFIYEATRKDELISLLSTDSESLVILDYILFNFEHVNELLILQQRFEKVHWLLFSDSLSVDFLKTALYSSSSFSVLLKESSQDEVNLALKEVMDGKRFICNQVSNLLVDNSRNVQLPSIKHLLTATEQAILKELALGNSTKEIAALRHLSIHTIMTHRKNIFRKIDVNNVHEATKYAMRAGLVDLAEYYI